MRLGLTYKNEEHIFDENVVNGVPYLSYPLLEGTGAVKHGFSTKLGGVSTGSCATMNISTTRGDDPEAVAENRRENWGGYRRAAGGYDLHASDPHHQCGSGPS